MNRLAVLGLIALAILPAVRADQGATPPAGNERLTVSVGKSLVIDSPLNIQRISVANGDLVEAVAVNPKEVLINGKAAGETTLIIWQQNGTRLLYDLSVRVSQAKLEAARAQIAREMPDQDVVITYENETAFVRGTVKDLIAAERVLSIAGTLGKTVNLLRVSMPAPETQILLRVRFANVDRGASSDLGATLASTAFNQITTTGTGQYGNVTVDTTPGGKGVTFSDVLNVFLFRRDINLGAAIKALQSKRLLEMLAEPNVLAINGKQASFVSGGEFPYPMLQGGAGSNAVTVAFREFGVRINFLPNITPRGSIRLQVSPEVSSLDYANGVTLQGFTIPALATRRIQTEVELESGQSFLIAGLLDRRMTETMNRMPGLGDIPLLGKLFQSKSITRNNSELLVIVTPEIVRPIPASQPLPELNYPGKFMPANTEAYPRTPGLDKTGPVPVQPASDSIPMEQLTQKQGAGSPGAAATPQIQIMPFPVPSGQPNVNPGLTPTSPLPGSGGTQK